MLNNVEQCSKCANLHHYKYRALFKNAQQCSTMLIKTKGINMHLQIVVDDGSNFIKTAHKIKEKIVLNSFPSRVTRSPELTEKGDYSAGNYALDEKSFFCVTTSATGVIPTDNRGYQTSETNAVLVHHALRLAKAKTADIVLTIPISQFFNVDGSKNKALIKAKKDNLNRNISPMAGGSCAAIGKVHVLPEGVPAFLYAKEALKLEKGQYLIADIGGTTTDLVSFTEDSNIDKFLSLQIGAISMLNHFKSLVTAKIELDNLPDRLVMKGLLGGAIAGTDVTKEAAYCIDRFNQEIIDNLSALGDLKTFDGVIFSGGGALLTDCKSKGFLMTDAPQFDNVNGALNIF